MDALDNLTGWTERNGDTIKVFVCFFPINVSRFDIYTPDQKHSLKSRAVKQPKPSLCDW